MRGFRGRMQWKELVEDALIYFLLAFTILFAAVNVSQAKEEVKYLKTITGELEEPVDAAVTNDGDIAVLDKATSRISLFDPNGKLKLTFAEKGSLPGQLYKPEAMIISASGEIIVADTGNNRVQVFS